MQIQICQKNPKKNSPHGCGSTAKREFCRAKFSSGIQKSMDGFLVPCFRQCKTEKVRILQKNRCKDAAAQESENFAEQNSRQESENPRMDFWFHVFGNAERKKSEFYKKK